jgi:CBS domain-containing protein
LKSRLPAVHLEQDEVKMTDLTVRDLMSTEVFTLGRNDKLAIADDLMQQKRIRHIPVLGNDGELCGIITQRDLFHGALLKALGYGTRAEQHMLETVSIKEAMRDEVLSTTPDTPIRVAAGTMISNKVGCLPVLAEGRIIGILSESDFVKHFAESDA